MGNTPLVVMCNGPSLKDIDLDILNDQDVFGMNGAYRYFYENAFWPKYFGCFDYRVTVNHRDDYAKLINSSPIEHFFLLNDCGVRESKRLTVLPENQMRGHIGHYSTTFDAFGFGGNTGANCCQVGICLGYKKIILIGADCNYKEIVDGASPSSGGLVMHKTPAENPNYFFDSYQREGDAYNFPQSDKYHLPAWNYLSKFAVSNDIDIVNCSSISTLECFRKSNIEEEL